MPSSHYGGAPTAHHSTDFGLPFSSAGYPVGLPGSYPSGHYFFGSGENCGFYNNAGCQQQQQTHHQQQYQQISPVAVERSASTSSSPGFESHQQVQQQQQQQVVLQQQQVQVKEDLLSESFSDHSSPRQGWSPLTPPTGV